MLNIFGVGEDTDMWSVLIVQPTPMVRFLSTIVFCWIVTALEDVTDNEGMHTRHEKIDVTVAVSKMPIVLSETENVLLLLMLIGIDRDADLSMILALQALPTFASLISKSFRWTLNMLQICREAYLYLVALQGGKDDHYYYYTNHPQYNGR